MLAKRVFVLGFDGATLDLIEPWVEQGHLPTLARLMEQGTYGRLRSVIPHISAAAWSSLVTGTNPGKHGIFDFYELDPQRYKIRYLNATHRRVPAIWKLLSDAGRRVGTINIPVTYPPETVNGFMIAGFDTPGLERGDFTYPSKLKERLNGYVIEVEHSLPKQERLEQWRAAIRMRYTTLHRLVQQENPDLVMTVFMAPDRVQHHFWKDMDVNHPVHMADEAKRYGDAILSIYRELDRGLGDLVASMNEDDLLIIVSDHGGGGQSNRSVHLNMLLDQWGLLRFRESGHDESVVRRHLRQLLVTTWERGRPLASLFLSAGLKNRVKASRLFARIRTEADSTLYFSDIDWSQTQAYSEEDRAYIRINLKGREREGIVPEHEYEALCGQIIERLSRLEDPRTGTRMVETVYRRQDLFHGPYVENAPDLIAWFIEDPYNFGFDPSARSSGTSWLSEYSVEQYHGERAKGLTGNHRLDGILFMYGPGVVRGHRINAAIVDVAPSILYLLGHPVPNYMDGRVLEEALEPDLLARHPVRIVDTTMNGYGEPEIVHYTEGEEGMIEDHLRGLGYLG